MVEPAEVARALDREHVRRLLDDADRRPVAAGRRADGARVRVGHVEADRARRDLVLGRDEGAGQLDDLLAGHFEHERREALGRLAADGRQLRELLDEGLDGLGGQVHRVGRTGAGQDRPGR